MSERAKKPTETQAKFLSRMFGGDLQINASSTSGATVRVLLRNGWIKPTGEVDQYPNGFEYRVHVISEAGIDALENHLRAARFDRKKSGRAA